MALANYIPDPREMVGLPSRAYDCCDSCVGPNPPSNLVLNAAGAFVLDVSWTDNASDETGFDIRWRNVTLSSGFTNEPSNAANDVTAQITVTGANDGDTIEVQVRAAGASCDSDWVANTVIIVGTN